MSALKIVSSSLLALALAACTMAPDYERPELPVAAAWPQEGEGSPGGDVTSMEWQAFFRSEPMRKIIGIALEHNRDLRVAALKVEQARATYRVERSALLPSIDATGSMTRQGVPENASTTGRDMISSSYTANLASTSYELDLFGRVRSLNEQALEQFFATQEAQKATRISLIAETANAYLTYLSDKKLSSIAANTLKTQQETYNITKRRAELGLGSQMDVEQAKAQLESVRSDRERYQRAVAQDRNALELLCGKPLTAAELDGVTLDQVALLDRLPVGLPSSVLLQRPDILQAEHSLKAANANIGAARAAFFPTISLTGSAGFASDNLADLFKSGSTLAWTFAPQVTMPIFNTGRNLANLDNADASQKIAAAQYEKAIQVAFREVSDQLAARKTYEQQMLAMRAAVEASGNAYKFAKLRYEQGSDSHLSELIAQRDLYSAQQSETTVKMERLSNLVSLYKVLGGGAN